MENQGIFKIGFPCPRCGRDVWGPWGKLRERCLTCGKTRSIPWLVSQEPGVTILSGETHFADPGAYMNRISTSDIAYRAVALYDAHLIPKDGPHPSYLVAKQFVKDIKPEKLILGGDFSEIESLSFWERKKGLLMEGRRYQGDIDMACFELDDIRKALPDSEIFYFVGNHEDRVARYVEDHPMLAGKLDIQKDLRADEFDLKWIPLNESIEIGHLHFIHGWFWNQWHTKKTLQTFGDNIMYGHVHEYQLHTQFLRAQQTPHMAMACACLTDVNPTWKRGKPTRFTNGFGMIEYREDGNFQATHIVVIDNALSYGGRSWELK